MVPLEHIDKLLHEVDLRPNLFEAEKINGPMLGQCCEMGRMELGDMPGMSPIFRICRLRTSHLKKDGLSYRNSKCDPKTGLPEYGAWRRGERPSV